MELSILDASVVIKWFIKEEGSDLADLYLERLGNHDIKIIIPQLLFFEIGNILISRKVSEDESDYIAKKLYSLPFEQKQIDLQYFNAIILIAKTFGISFYDGAYIALMQEKNCEFITADRKLFQKVQKAFSGAKLLSD